MLGLRGWLLVCSVLVLSAVGITGETSAGATSGRSPAEAAKRSHRLPPCHAPRGKKPGSRRRHHAKCREDGAPAHPVKNFQIKPGNTGGGGTPDQYLPFATGKRVLLTQGNNSPCGWTHAPPGCNTIGLYTRWGWDFGVGTGTQLYSTTSGKVLIAGFESGGYGNTVQIQTPNGDCARYEHMSKVTVKVNQIVSRYTPIGLSGATGAVTGPHLHYQREICAGRSTGVGLPSSFIDAGVPRIDQTVTSGNGPESNSGDGTTTTTTPPADVRCPRDCHVYGASAGVNVRSGPSQSSSIVGHLDNGALVQITCQAPGSPVGNSSVWDKLDNQTYVSDYYVDTPGNGTFSAGVPRCDRPAAQSLAITGSSGYAMDSSGGLHAVGSAPDPGDQPSSNHYWPGWAIARSVVLRSDGRSGYVLDGWGALHPFGGAPALGDQSSHYWQGWDIARSVALRGDGAGGYVLDGWGGIHPFGNAPAAAGTGYWKGWDIARSIAVRPDGASGYVLDGWGGIHPFGGAPAVQGSAYWKGWDIARGIALRPDGTSGYVLDGWGAVHPFGGAPAVKISRYDKGQDDARALALTSSGNGGWVLFANGEVAPFGDAPAISNPWRSDDTQLDHQGGPH
jgi:hypothetical protein